MDMNHLLHKVQAVFFRLAMWFEVIFAMIIFIGVVFHLAHIPAVILGKEPEFIDFLQYLLEGLVGLELIMMLCRHDLDSIIEVMIFTVTKYLVVNHESAVGILIGVAAVAVLFAIRKFLFLSAEELAERKKHADYIQRDK